MLYTPNIVPGSWFKSFSIYERQNKISVSGRPVKDSYADTARSFYGILAEASQKDIELYKQNGHPITHTIVQHGAEPKAKSTDLLVCGDKKYYVHGANSPAAVCSAMIYHVEERLDMYE